VNLGCRSETCCTRLAENTGRKDRQKSPSGHHRTSFLGYIFATKVRVDNRTNLLNRNTSSTCPDNMNFGPLAAEISSEVWGTTANFNGFRVLAPLLHGTLVVGITQTCGVERRAPPIFDRAAVTLGIGHILVLSFFLRLISAVADWMSTILPHMVWP